MGFWSKLGGIATAVGGGVGMAFGLPTGSLIPVGLGMAFGGAGAGPGTKGWTPPPLTDEEKAQMARVNGVSDTLMGTSADLLGRSKGFTDLSLDSLTSAKNYWDPIIKGDYNATGEFLAPETNAIGRQFDLAKKNISNFVPSGGGKGAALGRSEYDKAFAVSDLIGKARPAAATALSTLGGTAGGVGSSLAGTGVQAGSVAANAAEAPLNFLSSRRGQDIYGGVATRGQDIALGEKTGAGIGAATSGILSKIPGLIGKKKAGTPYDYGGEYGLPGGGVLTDNGEWPGGYDYGGEYSFSEGGIVTRPTHALIGEDGPEAVIPLTRGKGPAKDPHYEMGRKVGAMIHMLSSQGKGRRRATA